MSSTDPMVTLNPELLRRYAVSPAVVGRRYVLGRAPVSQKVTDDGLGFSFSKVAYWAVPAAILVGFSAAAIGLVFAGGAAFAPMVLTAGVLFAGVLLVLRFPPEAVWRSPDIPFLKIDTGHFEYMGQRFARAEIGAMVIVRQFRGFGFSEAHLLLGHDGEPLCCLACGPILGNNAYLRDDYLTELDRVLRCGVWRILPNTMGERVLRVPPFFPKKRP